MRAESVGFGNCRFRFNPEFCDGFSFSNMDMKRFKGIPFI